MHIARPHLENSPMQYMVIFKVLKIENLQKKKFDIFLIFAQNIDCGSTHTLCFRSKIGKIGIHVLLHTPVLLYKRGVYGGILWTFMFYLCTIVTVLL